MTATYQLVSAKTSDVATMTANMRSEDAAEATGLGVPLKRALWRSFRSSFWRKSLFIDGELAAMCGVGGNLLGGVGYPWVVTTAAVERLPIRYFREARRETEDMLLVFPRLEGLIAANYTRSLRFFALMGFEIHPPQPWPGTGELFCKITMGREVRREKTM